ncbi:MAG: hypothetical protein ABID61_02590 [Candidatus Micrarchaeota archaeon]
MMTSLQDIVGNPVHILLLNSLTKQGFWEWFPLIGGALVVSATILAFLYMWSSLFRDQNLNALVKLELSELVITTALLLIILMGVGAVANLQIGTLLPQDLLPAKVVTTDNVWSVSEKYFEEVANDMGAWLELNYLLNWFFDSMATATVYARPLGVGIITAPLAGFASPIKQLLYNMTVALSVAYVINYAQLYVLTFAFVAFLKYYLPIGIILRSFTPTRRIGGTIIGVTIAFLFIYPFLVSITYMMFYSQNASPMVTWRSFASEYINDVTNGLGGKINGYFGNRLTGGFLDFVGGSLSSLGGALENVVGKTFLIAMMIPISIVGLAFGLGFIMPAFNILLFVQAARFLSKSLGEEMDITSLTRMI